MTTTRFPEVNLGITTTWLPLTTQGPPLPSRCSSAIYFVPGYNSFLIGFDPYYQADIDPTLTCLPTEATSWYFQKAGQTSTLYLGPFQCPLGYTTGSTSAQNAQTTVVMCCPSAYTFKSFLGPASILPGTAQCVSYLTSGSTIVAKSETGNPWTWVDTTAMIGDGAGASVAGAHINGFIFAAATTTTSSSISLSTTSVIPSPTNSDNSLGGLDTGAKAGIGVGVSLGVVGIACLIAFFFLLRRHRQKSAQGINGSKTQLPVELDHAKRERAYLVEAPSDTPKRPRLYEMSS